MIKLQKVINRLLSETDFGTVEIAQELQPNLQTRALYCGQISIEQIVVDKGSFDDFGQLLSENLLIQIVTSVMELEVDLLQVYQAIAGWVYADGTDTKDGSLSKFALVKGNLMAVNNGRIHWYYEFKITYPILGACL